MITTHKEPGQISQQDKFKEKILNTLNEHVLEQLHCLMLSKQRHFLYHSPFCLTYKKCKGKIFDVVVISKLHSILLKSIT